MWICKNCHEKIEEPFTGCWKCGYSIEGNPPSGAIPDPDEERVAGPPPKKLWKPRLKAYIVDYIILVVGWALVDNLIYFPIHEVIIELGSLLFFCCYFWYFEGRPEVNQSLGKRWLGLKVVTLGGLPVSAGTVFRRSAIVGAMVFVDFTWLVSLLHVPMAVVWLGWSVPAGLAVYNVWLAVKHPSGMMLQDHLTSTRVVHISEKPKEATAAPAEADPEPMLKLPRPGLALSCIVAVTILTLAWVHGIHVFVGAGDPWTWPDHEAADVVTLMEQAVADELGVRCHVSLTATRRITTAGEDVHGLEISIWIPAVMWKKETLAKLPAVALEPLIVTPGFYDAGELKMWTGFENMNASRAINLDMP